MHRHLSVVVTVTTAAFLVGCGQADASRQDDSDGSGSRAETGNAFDIFLGDELGLVDYAVRRTRNECLAEAGYPQNLEGMADGSSNPFPCLVISESSFGPTSEDEARRLGFGQDAPAQPARIVSFDPNYDLNLERCAQEAYDALGPEARDVVDSYNDLGNTTHNEFIVRLEELIQDELPGATRQLLDCMIGQGYHAADEDAFLQEPDPQAFGIEFGDYEGGGDDWQPERIEGTVQVGPPVPAQKYVPTPEESELAVAWFQCRRDIGMTKQLMALAERAQAEIVADHEHEFSELNPKLEDVAETAAQLVGD